MKLTRTNKGTNGAVSYADGTIYLDPVEVFDLKKIFWATRINRFIKFSITINRL